MNYLDGIYTVRMDEKVRREELKYMMKPLKWREISVILALVATVSFNGLVS